MTVLTKDELKLLFKKGLYPSEEDFAKLIDSSGGDGGSSPLQSLGGILIGNVNQDLVETVSSFDLTVLGTSSDPVLVSCLTITVPRVVSGKPIHIDLYAAVKFNNLDNLGWSGAVFNIHKDTSSGPTLGEVYIVVDPKYSIGDDNQIYHNFVDPDPTTGVYVLTFEWEDVPAHPLTISYSGLSLCSYNYGDLVNTEVVIDPSSGPETNLKYRQGRVLQLDTDLIPYWDDLTRGHIIRDHNTDMPIESTLNFIGNGVSITDTIDETTINILGSPFATDIVVNGLTVGRGHNGHNGSTALGLGALAKDVSESYGYNTAIGGYSLAETLDGVGNVAVGFYSLSNAGAAYSGSHTSGSNTAIGTSSMLSLAFGSNNVAVGHQAGNQTYLTGLDLNGNSNNNNDSCDDSIFIGKGSKAYDKGDTNEIVIGFGAIGQGSNSVVLGNDSIANTYLKGTVSIDMLQQTGSLAGFFGTLPVAKPTGVAVTAEGIHAALVTLGLISA